MLHKAVVLLLLLSSGPVYHVVGQQPSDTCKNAIDALLLAGKLFAGAANNTFISPLRSNAGPGVTPNLQALWNTVQANLSATVAGIQTSLFSLVPSPPFGGWASRALQTALGQAPYAPASTLGELAYLSNTVQRQYNASTPYYVAAQGWFNQAMSIVRELRGQTDNVTDDLSLRSMHLRAMMYSFVGQWPLPPGNTSSDVYAQAAQDFMSAMEFFQGYRFLQFSYSYSNGTLTTEFPGHLVLPSDQPNPLIIVLGSLLNWRENTFVRYGLSALRRNYAVVTLDLPGMTVWNGRAGAMGAVSDPTDIVQRVFEILSDIRYRAFVDLNEVYLLSAISSTYGAVRACQNLSPRLKGCIFNPGVIDHGEIYANGAARALFSALQVIASSNSEAIPTQTLVAAYSNPLTNIVLPLVLNCSASSGAPEALAVVMEAKGYDPELGLALVSALGTISPPSIEAVDQATWAAIKRMVLDAPKLTNINITVPVLVVGGDQDTGYSGQEQRLWDALPEAARRKGLIKIYRGQSGAALGGQNGATLVFDQDLYTWINSLRQ